MQPTGGGWCGCGRYACIEWHVLGWSGWFILGIGSCRSFFLLRRGMGALAHTRFNCVLQLCTTSPPTFHHPPATVSDTVDTNPLPVSSVSRLSTHRSPRVQQRNVVEVAYACDVIPGSTHPEAPGSIRTLEQTAGRRPRTRLCQSWGGWRRLRRIATEPPRVPGGLERPLRSLRTRAPGPVTRCGGLTRGSCRPFPRAWQCSSSAAARAQVSSRWSSSSATEWRHLPATGTRTCRVVRSHATSTLIRTSCTWATVAT